jgi:hypothetical protein
METKLTLKLSSSTINQAKRYIRRHKGYSLSRLVENYFDSLTRDEKQNRSRIPPIVSSLAGALKNKNIGNPSDDYSAYLLEKYK